MWEVLSYKLLNIVDRGPEIHRNIDIKGARKAHIQKVKGVGGGGMAGAYSGDGAKGVAATPIFVGANEPTQTFKKEMKKGEKRGKGEKRANIMYHSETLHYILRQEVT